MILRKESAGSEIKAFLGKGSEFEGKLTFNESVRIDGSFKGQIVSSDTLIIGDDATVTAEIEVGNAIISGTVEGNIKAGNKLEIHPPAKVTGTITTPKLIIIEGAIFEGQCHMVNVAEGKKAETTKKPALLNKLEAAG